MEYRNFKNLGYTDAGYSPYYNHVLWEKESNDYLYLVDAIDKKKIYRSINRGETWAQMSFTTSTNIRVGVFSTTNNRIELMCPSGVNCGIYYADLTNNWILSTVNVNNAQGIDVFEYSNNHYFMYFLAAGGNLYLNLYKVYPTLSIIKTQLIGVISGRTYSASFTIVNGTKVYFLFQWSNGNPIVYQYNFSGNTFTALEDCGSSKTIFNLIDNQRGLSYDGSDLLYFIIEDTGDNKKYLHSYSLSGDTVVKGGEYNVSLMLDRNAWSAIEKAFHLTNREVYQIGSSRHYLNYISNLKELVADGTIIGISNNYLFLERSSNDVEIYEFTEINSIINVDFTHEIMKWSEGTLGVNRDDITIEKGMFMQIEGKYTSAGSSSDEVIFEGIVVDFDGERLQKVWLESPAKKELKNIKPRGDFSGRSDEIMTELISTYCKYIIKGVFSTGTAMGTVTYAGDKSLWTILNELALFEKWIWYLAPQGQLYFNNGTIDSLVNLSETDKVWNVKSGNIREPFNYFYIKGAIVSGVQLYKEIQAADDLESQQLHGFNPFEETYASFNTQTILDQLASNIKARLKEVPLAVEHWYYDTSLGMIQVGETLTFVYNTTEVNISSDQFLINRVFFKAKQNSGGYTITDELI